MGQHRTGPRGVFAMLCIALALVYAGASAASVVDRIQHSRHIAHDHELHLAFVDDHADRDHHADHDQSDGAGDQDPRPGAGHHHVDAPAGGLSGSTSSAPVVQVAVIPPVSIATASPDGLWPGALERPPRPPLATLV